ncbi:MAG: TolC family protein [Cyclobacteriaceae bacterium]
MKSLISLLLIPLLTLQAWSQAALTLQECYERAETNYPLIRQRELLEQTKNLSIENVLKGYLPQITIGGQGTYQSEVTQIPVEMPGVEPLSNDQYRIFGEVSQTLYHGGLVSQQRKMEEVNAAIEERKLAVDLYQLKNRINELFFGILFLQAQTVQSELIKDDINAGLKRTEAAIANGTAIRSGADVLRAELLRIEQRIIEMQSSENTYREILGIFIKAKVDETTLLQKPQFNTAPSTISRPELALFDAQKQSIEINNALLSARRRPRMELFVQGGYGRPGLNMLENSFNFYYLGGIRFSWLLSGYYTFRREKEVLNLRQRSLDVQKETFLFNTGLTINQHDAEVAKLRRLIEVDDEIIALRSRVRQTAEIQLEEGVITPTDFMREVNAEDQAKQNLALHETQLMMSQAKYQFASGQ